MKLTIPRDTLAALTGWATASASLGIPDGTTPILAGLMLTAEADGHLTAARFGYEASASARAAAEVGEPGRVLVPARLLTEVAAALPAGVPAEVAFDGTRVTLDAGGYRYTLLALPAGQYPDLPAEPPGHAAEFDPQELATAVAIAAGAAGTDRTLPVLNCVRIALDGKGTATLSATDRYRAAIVTCPCTAGPGEAAGAALVPARELAAAARRPGAGPVRLAVTPEAVSLASEGRHVTIRQFQGEGLFPDQAVGRALTEAATSAATALAEVEPLAAAVKRAAVVAAKNTPARFHFTADGVRVEAGTGDEATLAATVALTLDGDPVAVNFNPGYLLDGLAAVTAAGSDTARIAIIPDNKPAVITPAEAGAVGSTYVLMPVRNAG